MICLNFVDSSATKWFSAGLDDSAFVSGAPLVIWQSRRYALRAKQFDAQINFKRMPVYGSLGQIRRDASRSRKI